MQAQIRTNSPFQSFYKEISDCKIKSSSQILRKDLNAQPDVFSHEEKSKKNKPLIALCGFLGATLPIIAINVAKGKGGALIETFKNKASTKKDKFKSLFNMFEMNNFSDLFASATGAIGAGVFSGILTDKNPKNRIEKKKEGTFEFLNFAIPTAILAGAEKISEKKGVLNSRISKALMVAGSVGGGMFIANKASNKINEKLYAKDGEKQEKRNFKISDCFVHIDDILGLLVIAKFPLAKFLQADKILPLIYTKIGYESGSAEACEPKSQNI